MDGYENLDAESLRIEREMAQENKELRADVERLRNRASGLAAHQGDPCKYCGADHDDVLPGPCMATRDWLADELSRREAQVERLRGLIVDLDSALSLVWHRHTTAQVRSDFELSQMVDQAIGKARRALEGK